MRYAYKPYENEQGESRSYLLANNEPESSKHPHAPVRDLGLAPALNFIYACLLGQAKGVEEAGELGNPREGLGVCLLDIQEEYSLVARD
jgi:hypothetical protein